MSKDAGKSELIRLCFYEDETYFISADCKDLSCKPMRELKQMKSPTSSLERPGAALCQELKGITEDVSISEKKNTIQRCLFPKDRFSISLNLLESWDGKKFRGPSRPLSI